jgi:hypothetical protein
VALALLKVVVAIFSYVVAILSFDSVKGKVLNAIGSVTAHTK